MAFDLAVTSLLNPITLNEACVTAGSSAQISEQRKHASNDAKCSELGWHAYHWLLRPMDAGELKPEYSSVALPHA